MRISLVAAVGKNRVIGKNNRLPWHLPADLRHFRELTMGKPVIMGRKTFESIGKALPGRQNIVISRDSDFSPSGCVVVHSPGEAQEAAKGAEEVMVIGGESIYKEFLPKAERIYLTEINADFPGDAFFPEFNREEWEEVSRQNFVPDRENSYTYSFLVLERKKG